MDICNKILEQCAPGKLPSCLICGKPGIGKTSVAPILAEMLTKKYNKNVVIYSGFDILNEKHTMGMIFEKGIHDKLYILCIDDVDIGIQFADQNKDILQTGKGKCAIARNKVSYNRALDIFKTFTQIMIFATANTSADELTAKFPSYVREGRFDIKINMPDTK